jgi:hypothetical protein
MGFQITKRLILRDSITATFKVMDHLFCLFNGIFVDYTAKTFAIRASAKEVEPTILPFSSLRDYGILAGADSRSTGKSYRFVGFAKHQTVAKEYVSSLIIRVRLFTEKGPQSMELPLFRLTFLARDGSNIPIGGREYQSCLRFAHSIADELRDIIQLNKENAQ